MVLRLVLSLILLTGCSMIGGVAYGGHEDTYKDYGELPVCQPDSWGWWLIAPGDEKEPARLYVTTQNLQMDYEEDQEFDIQIEKIFCVMYPLAPIYTMGPSKTVKHNKRPSLKDLQIFSVDYGVRRPDVSK